MERVKMGEKWGWRAHERESRSRGAHGDRAEQRPLKSPGAALYEAPMVHGTGLIGPKVGKGRVGLNQAPGSTSTCWRQREGTPHAGVSPLLPPGQIAAPSSSTFRG